jgi:hypothetical protein
MGLSPLGNLCAKKQQNKFISKENPNIAKKASQLKKTLVNYQYGNIVVINKRKTKWLT